MIVMIVFASAGGLLALLGIPMLKRMVPPNYVYGLRTGATLSDEAIWYEANAQSGRDSIIAGVAIVAVALLLFIARVPEAIAAWISVGFALFGVVVMALNGWRFANQLSRQRDKRGAAV